MRVVKNYAQGVIAVDVSNIAKSNVTLRPVWLRACDCGPIENVALLNGYVVRKKLAVPAKHLTFNS